MSFKQSRETLQRVLRVLDDTGAAHEVDRGGKHVKVRFTYRDRRCMYTMPSTQSDSRTTQNCVAGVRRLLRQIDAEHGNTGEKNDD